MHWYSDGSRRRADRGNSAHEPYLSKVKAQAQVNECNLFAQP